MAAADTRASMSRASDWQRARAAAKVKYTVYYTTGSEPQTLRNSSSASWCEIELSVGCRQADAWHLARKLQLLEKLYDGNE